MDLVVIFVLNFRIFFIGAQSQEGRGQFMGGKLGGGLIAGVGEWCVCLGGGGGLNVYIVS